MNFACTNCVLQNRPYESVWLRKGKAIPTQVNIGSESPGNLRLAFFKKIGT